MNVTLETLDEGRTIIRSGDGVDLFKGSEDDARRRLPMLEALVKRLKGTTRRTRREAEGYDDVVALYHGSGGGAHSARR